MFKGRLPFGPTGKDVNRRLRADGDAAMVLRNWSDAVRNYKEYLVARPDDAPIWVQLGHALKESGHRQEAADAYNKALQAAPNDSDATVHLADLLKHLGKDNAAIEAPVDLTVSTGGIAPVGAPATELTRRAQGDSARDRKDWRNAALFYCEHLAAHRDDAAIWVQLGHMLKEHGDREDAVEAYRTAKRLEVTPSDVSVHLAELLMLMGKPAEAEPLWAEMYRKSGTFFLPTR